MALPDVDTAELAAVVRQALGKPEARVVSWMATPLEGGFAAEGGVFRVSGIARDGEILVSWSVVLKEAIRPNTVDFEGSDAPQHFHHWRREPLAYQSGLLTPMGYGLRAPCCFGVRLPTNSSYRLWVEYIPDAFEGLWPLERYALAARHLGEFNAAFLAHRPLPHDVWLNRQYLRKYVALGCEEPVVAQIRDATTWQFPRVRQLFDATVAERLLGVWADTARLVDAAEALPQTLCHLDPHRRNLLARVGGDGTQETVAIDWAGIGLDALGVDAAQFAIATLVFDGVPEESCQHFAERVFDAYLEGLHRAGWTGDPADVRLGFCAFAVVRWGINVAGLVLMNAATQDPAVHAATQQWLGRPVDELLERWATLTYLLLGLSEEARTLAKRFTG